MEVLHPHCAGLDVHQKTVVACVRKAQGGHVETETRTFPTSTPGCSCSPPGSTNTASRTP